MIKLSVDEGYAFDYLSILAVKISKKPEDRALIARFYVNYNEIMEQIGHNLHGDIINSYEYSNLFEVNRILFELIDEIKKILPPPKEAMEIDAKNYERFLWKKKIQEKFFPNIEFGEKKIGYNE